MVTINQGIPDLEWDEHLTRLGGHFLQSRAWAQFQLALGRDLIWARSDKWSWLATRREGRGVTYLSVPYGPTVAGDLKQVIDSLKLAGKAQGVDFVRIEPMGKLAASDLRQTGARAFSEVNPSYTWVLDLRPDEAILRSNLSSGNRNIVNTAESKGIACRLASYDEIGPFLDMLHETYDRAKIKAFDDDYYRKTLVSLEPLGAARLFYAEFEGKVVAGAIVYDFNGVRHYAHAAANQAVNREVNAARALVWQMIIDAKQNGFNTFDFWGVAPTDDPNHPWHGLSKFKKSFGGSAVEYAGTWDLPLKGAKYQAYRLAKRVLS